MAIWMNIFIEANEGMGSELAESYAKRCPAIREEPGCIQFEFYQSVDRPDCFILHEEWADEAALDAHRLLCLLYTSPSPRDLSTSRMPSSA